MKFIRTYVEKLKSKTIEWAQEHVIYSQKLTIFPSDYQQTVSFNQCNQWEFAFTSRRLTFLEWRCCLGYATWASLKNFYRRSLLPLFHLIFRLLTSASVAVNPSLFSLSWWAESESSHESYASFLPILILISAFFFIFPRQLWRLASIGLI